MIQFPIEYINGNYKVKILEDGTKIKETEDDIFIPDRVETIDLNISNYCENNCPYCYIDASVKGKHGNLNHNILDTIPEYTEIAINYSKHPDLEDFLIRMRLKNIIVNITINQNDFIKDFQYLYSYQYYKLIYGIGISINEMNENIKNELKQKIKLMSNVVIHTIAGITDIDTYKYIKDLNDKVLILGFKNKGRGKKIKPDLNNLNIQNIFKLFNIVSFDNLALEQLNIKNIISEKEWNKSYMGDDGEFSFFIDLVENKFYKSSISENGFNINNLTIKEMFNVINQN